MKPVTVRKSVDGTVKKISKKRYFKRYKPGAEIQKTRRGLAHSTSLHHPCIQKCKRIGRTLISKDYGRPIKKGEIATYLGQLVSALKYLDRKGLVYTDLKRGNICVKKGRITLIDLESVCRTGTSHFSYTWENVPNVDFLQESYISGVRKDWHWEILELLKNRDNVNTN